MKYYNKVYKYGYIGDRFIFHNEYECYLVSEFKVLFFDLSYGTIDEDDFEYAEEIK